MRTLAPILEDYVIFPSLSRPEIGVRSVLFRKVLDLEIQSVFLDLESRMIVLNVNDRLITMYTPSEEGQTGLFRFLETFWGTSCSFVLVGD